MAIKQAARLPDNGAVASFTRQVNFDSGSTLVGTIPSGHVINKAASGVTVKTPFNAELTNTMDIGTAGDSTAFATGLDTSAADFVPLSAGDSLVLGSGLPTEVYAVPKSTGAAATAGVSFVTIIYTRIDT